MDEQPLFRGRGAVVAMLVVAVLVMIAFLGGADQQEPSNRRSSTYSAGPAGTKAFAELLRTAGFQVAQVRVPVAETAPDPKATVVVSTPASIAPMKRRSRHSCPLEVVWCWRDRGSRMSPSRCWD